MPKNRNANFPSFRFGRFGIPFGSIDIASEGRGGPLCRCRQYKAGTQWKSDNHLQEQAKVSTQYKWIAVSLLVPREHDLS